MSTYFSAPKKKKNLSRFVPLLILLAVILLFAFGSEHLSASGSSHEEEIVTSALERSITQCYALEGFYPPSLEYLSDHYGFTYNADHFFIDYRYIGSNLRPDVTIIKRESEN
jgi:hypothetical protein